MSRRACVALLALAAGCAARGVHTRSPAVARCEAPAPDAPDVLFGDARMVPLCRDAYVEPAATIDEREALARNSGLAVREVDGALGGLRNARPVVIYCKTDACRVYFAGPARRSWALSPHDRCPGATYVAGDRPTVIIVRVDAAAVNVLAHEMVHIELYARVRHAFVPLWFHEGVAASIGNEPRCEGATANGVDDLRRLDSNRAWGEHTNLPGRLAPTYCQARREVEAWVRCVGRARFFALLDAVRDGAPFYQEYGPMMTQ